MEIENPPELDELLDAELLDAELLDACSSRSTSDTETPLLYTSSAIEESREYDLN